VAWFLGKRRKIRKKAMSMSVYGKLERERATGLVPRIHRRCHIAWVALLVQV
jgi:hypothetical protein